MKMVMRSSNDSTVAAGVVGVDNEWTDADAAAAAVGMATVGRVDCLDLRY